MCVLDFPRFIGGSLHHLAGLADGLFPGQLVDGLRLAVGLRQQGIGIRLGLGADLVRLGPGIGQHLFLLVEHLLTGFIVGAALDAQRRLGIFRPFGQFLLFPGQVGVFQPQHRVARSSCRRAILSA